MSYDVSVCRCDAGPYLGARKAGTPCCCEVCGFITQEQLDHLARRSVNEGVRLAATLVRDHVLGDFGQRVSDFLIDRADRVIPPGESATQDGAP